MDEDAFTSFSQLQFLCDLPVQPLFVPHAGPAAPMEIDFAAAQGLEPQPHLLCAQHCPVVPNQPPLLVRDVAGEQGKGRDEKVGGGKEGVIAGQYSHVVHLVRRSLESNALGEHLLNLSHIASLQSL